MIPDFGLQTKAMRQAPKESHLYSLRHYSLVTYWRKPERAEPWECEHVEGAGRCHTRFIKKAV